MPLFLKKVEKRRRHLLSSIDTMQLHDLPVEIDVHADCSNVPPTQLRIYSCSIEGRILTASSWCGGIFQPKSAY